MAAATPTLGHLSEVGTTVLDRPTDPVGVLDDPTKAFSNHPSSLSRKRGDVEGTGIHQIGIPGKRPRI
jgi:hypothetical protein